MKGLKKENVSQSFSVDWSQKWVPAILKYARRTKRKEIHKLLEGVIDKGNINTFLCWQLKYISQVVLV